MTKRWIIKCNITNESSETRGFYSHLVANFCCTIDCLFESALEFNSNQPIMDLNERNKLRGNFQTLPFAFGQTAFRPCWTSLQGRLYRMNWSARRLRCVLDKKSWKKWNFRWIIIKVRCSACNNKLKTVMHKLLTFLWRIMFCFLMTIVSHGFWFQRTKRLLYFSPLELHFRIFDNLGVFLFM